MNLPSLLSKGSEHYGFTGYYCSGTPPAYKRVGYVIKKEWGVTYEVKQVGVYP